MMKFKLALLQTKVSINKKENLDKAVDFIRKAKAAGSSIAVLPECFNCPYGIQYFSEYAELIPQGETSQLMSNIAKETDMIIIAGSIPEKHESKLYNTSTVWNNDGKLLATHRKIHLFDINIPGKISFTESKTLFSGDKITIVDTQYGKIGIGICYDMRFPELAMIASRAGANLMVYPGAFNMITGPLHWELIQRARAVDNQMYVATCSPARDNGSSYIAYGHSMLCDPMGEVLVEADENERIVYGEIDLNKVKETRENIPVSVQRRFDLYPDVSAK